MNKNELLTIVAQGFYGNKTVTEISVDSVDRFILGYQDASIPVSKPLNRSFIQIPDSTSLVIVYNKYQEEEQLKKKEKWLDEGYEMKPLVNIEEMNISIYSRCIVCRIDANGNFESLRNEDYQKFMKYLAD